MSSRMVHVARGGKVIGQYPPEQIASLFDTGHFVPSDLCFSEAIPEWTPVEEFLKKADAPRFSRAKEKAPEPDSQKSGSPQGSRRGSRRSRRGGPSGALLGGWIAFLLALTAVVGLVVWIGALHDQISELKGEVEKAEARAVASEKEYQRLLFVAREVAEPGVARGNVVLRNEAGKRMAIPGLQVGLYPRRQMEDYLDQKFPELASLPQGADPLAFLLGGLPQPAATTSTDASGRFEFKVPEPGEYVLVAILGNSGGETGRVWLVGFDSRDSVNSLIEVNDANSVQQLVRSLMIVEGR
ncbi:MAG: hypothetical protein SFU53_13635 [Terrimicrobiaceae bacterium]|nr:hypothetical protein [Terrimicrobiaceae bacterium]